VVKESAEGKPWIAAEPNSDIANARVIGFELVPETTLIASIGSEQRTTATTTMPLRRAIDCAISPCDIFKSALHRPFTRRLNPFGSRLVEFFCSGGSVGKATRGISHHQ
jgi:hypothetical protein